MIKVRIATADDYSLLAELGRKTFYETWRPVNTEEDMQAFMKDSFNPVKIKNDIEDSEINTFLLVDFDDQCVGYAKLRRDRTYQEFGDDSSIEIERIYVKKDFQHKKLGKALMDRCIEIAMEENCNWIWLGVNIDNIKAIDFYKRYGFIIFGEKAFQLGEANDNDYLMKKSLRS